LKSTSLYMLKLWHAQMAAKQLPRSARGGVPWLSAAELITVLVWGAWRGLSAKAELY